MKLSVHVAQARNLRAMDSNGFSDPYVKLQLGKQRFKTKVIKMNLNPTWDQEFIFDVGNIKDVLKVLVYDEDMLTMDDFLGKVKVPLENVFAAENFSLGTQWYRLHPKNKNEKAVDCGEICMAISLSHISFEEAITATRSLSNDLVIKSIDVKGEYSLSGNQSEELSSASVCDETRASPKDKSNGCFDGTKNSTENQCKECFDGSKSTTDNRSNGALNGTETSRENKSTGSSFFDRLYQMFAGKNVDTALPPSTDAESSIAVREASRIHQVSDNQIGDECSDIPFDELLKSYDSAHQGIEMPGNLQGGVLVDQSYFISPSGLNTFLFAPTSTFRQTVVELQGCTDYLVGPWRTENDGEILKRVVSYTTAPSKLVRAVRATEEQTYSKADRKEYSVLLSVSTPDVPFGSCFRTEILFRIMPGPELESEQQSSRLVISWRINFLQSTMLKGMIENGARQGLEQSYVQFCDVLSQQIKPIDTDTGSDKEQILASLQARQESDWKLAFLYFGNFSVLSSVFVTMYVLVHILLSNSSVVQGLEFSGLDLPDSLGEIIVGGVLVLQVQLTFNQIARFIQAREQKAGDHGVKAQGDGWLLTIALIEGTQLAPVDATGFSDPYVVFTCNSKTKTSSIRFQTLEPQWNEIFEFDAMDNPPSTMDINVYDFDGPFDEVTSLGHTKINFVKSNLSELADIWIPLEGNLAQSWQSKLHLRIFLNNTKGTGMAREYLSKMEKEVGKKMTLRSPRTNTAFQELFSLPSEEFLISDLTCYLKRKLPTQGHLFLSPRTIGFHSNMFGRKTKFFFLWEDIEDIQVLPPSMSTMWSPSLVIVLHRGRGMDAKHGAKSMEDGKLRFYLQSFASFSVANRIIMALWKARSLSLEHKVQIVEEQSQTNTFQSEDTGIFVGIEDAKSLQMSEVFSSAISVNMTPLMEVFEGGPLETKVMEKVGCLNYSVTQWESDKPDEYQRQVHYKFSKKLSPVGGEVTGTQQKSPLPDKKGWIIEEVMELQGVLLGDFFTLHIKYQIEDLAPKQKACHVQVSLGIEWLKTTRHQKRITENVVSSSSARLKDMFNLVMKELTQAK